MKEEIVTILLAMTPTLEAHGALTVAIGLFKFGAVKAFLLTTLGTLIIIVPVTAFWHYLSEFLMHRIYLVNRFLTWVFSYTRRRHTHHFQMFGQTETEPARIAFWKLVALYLFVAIPGPFTGVWGGTVAAFVFGIPFWRGVGVIALGAVSVALIDVLIISGFFSLIF